MEIVMVMVVGGFMDYCSFLVGCCSAGSHFWWIKLV